MTDTVDTAPPPAAVPMRRRERLVERLRHRDRTELALWIGVVAVALFLRLYDLGARPFHHDESQDAYFSYTFSQDFGSYEYNPLLHGPVRFYLIAAFYKLLGDSDFTARLAPALMGTLLVALPYLLRRQLGRTAALSAAVVLAVSPSLLYFSRFTREDIYLAAISLAFTVAIFRYLHRPRTLTLCVVGALIPIAFGVKESGLVMVGLAALFILAAIAVQVALARRRGTDPLHTEVVGAVRAVGWGGWAAAVAVMLFTYALIFTQFFTNWTCETTAYKGSPAHSTSCLNGVVYGIQYWRAQQAVGRGDDEPGLYFSILFGNEWPVLLLAAVGIVFAFRRPTTLKFFLLWMFAATLAFLSWGSERFAWLVVHPLVPLVLLAGLGVQALWQLRSRGARTAGMVAVALGAVYLIGASFSANARQGVDPRSLLVSTQSSQQVSDVVDQVRRLDRQGQAAGRPPLTITVDSADGATFPWAWYFRDAEVGYVDMTQDGFVPEAQVLVMTEGARAKQLPNLAAYAGRPFDFRVWWIKTPYHEHVFKPATWWRWWTKRETWTETGGMKEWFYVRRDAGALPGRGTKSRIPPPPA